MSLGLIGTSLGQFKGCSRGFQDLHYDGCGIHVIYKWPSSPLNMASISLLLPAVSRWHMGPIDLLNHVWFLFLVCGVWDFNVTPFSSLSVQLWVFFRISGPP